MRNQLKANFLYYKYINILQNNQKIYLKNKKRFVCALLKSHHKKIKKVWCSARSFLKLKCADYIALNGENIPDLNYKFMS